MPAHRMFRGLIQRLVLLGLVAVPTLGWAAFEFRGSKALMAVTGDGSRTPIGTIDFTPANGGAARFALRLRTEVFTDHFLSMREFKCLPGAQEISCHVPYPYPQPSTVSANDLAWLEHSLLFLHKSPAEFGAKLWNGVIYVFQVEGDTLVGTPHAVDLNEISAPPANPAQPPFGKAHRDETPAHARWLTRLVIE